jgi:hypothetical protein
LFENPAKISISPMDLIKRFGAQRVDSIADVPQYLSAVDSAGRFDRTDWRIIRGRVERCSVWTRKDGSGYQGGVINIIDSSVDSYDQVDDEGNASGGLTGWSAPEWATYQRFDMVELCGPITESRRTKEISMDVYYVHPLIVQPKPEPVGGSDGEEEEDVFNG